MLRISAVPRQDDPIVKTDGPIDEFGRHEGNDGLRDILTSARYEERVAEEAARKK